MTISKIRFEQTVAMDMVGEGNNDENSCQDSPHRHKGCFTGLPSIHLDPVSRLLLGDSADLLRSRRRVPLEGKGCHSATLAEIQRSYPWKWKPIAPEKISKENERYVSAGFQKWFGPVTAVQLQFPPLKIGLLVALGPLSVSVLYLGEYWPGNVCLWHILRRSACT
jgi:hypothetical protein